MTLFRNQSIDLRSKSIVWFLYDDNFGVQWIKWNACNFFPLENILICSFLQMFHLFEFLINLPKIRNLQGSVLSLNWEFCVSCYHQNFFVVFNGQNLIVQSSNGNARTKTAEICQWRRSVVSIVNFEKILRIVWVFPLPTLNQ